MPLPGFSAGIFVRGDNRILRRGWAAPNFGMLEGLTPPYRGKRGRAFRGKPPEPEHRVNQRIRANQVRLIGNDGEQLGVFDPREALKMAQEQGYDLVEIAAKSDPPVCKIMDYGRFLYEQNKKQHQARKHQKGHKLKEVKFRPRTDQHDYNFKKKHAIRFLEDGDKVKAIIMFRGREMAHRDIGYAKLEKLVEDVAEYGEPEKRPSMEGRWLHVIIAPRATKPKAKAKPEAEAEAGADAEGKAKPKAKAKAKAKPKAKAKTKGEAEASAEASA